MTGGNGLSNRSQTMRTIVGAMGQRLGAGKDLSMSQGRRAECGDRQAG